MQKRTFWTALIVGTLLAGALIAADTTFKWTGAAQSGNLVYWQLYLSGPNISNAIFGGSTTGLVSTLPLTSNYMWIGNSAGIAAQSAVTSVVDVLSNGAVANAVAKDTIVSNSVILQITTASNGAVANAAANATTVSNAVILQITTASNGAVASATALDTTASNGAVAEAKANATVVSNSVLLQITTASNGAVASAAALDTIVSNGLAASVWGAPSVAATTNLTTNTVQIQTRTAAGANLAGYRLLQVWISTTNGGDPVTNNVESLTLSAGTAVATITAAAHYWYATGSGGTATAVIVGSAAGTNFLAVADGSSVSNAAIVFTE